MDFPPIAERINWDEVPDDELEETYFERIEALKEMFPEKFRNKVSNTFNWTCWIAKSSFAFSRNAVWILSTTFSIMLLPYLIEKELSDELKNQAKSQQQLLLGPAMMTKGNKLN